MMQSRNGTMVNFKIDKKITSVKLGQNNTHDSQGVLVTDVKLPIH